MASDGELESAVYALTVSVQADEPVKRSGGGGAFSILALAALLAAALASPGRSKIVQFHIK